MFGISYDQEVVKVAAITVTLGIVLILVLWHHNPEDESACPNCGNDDCEGCSPI